MFKKEFITAHNVPNSYHIGLVCHGGILTLKELKTCPKVAQQISGRVSIQPDPSGSKEPVPFSLFVESACQPSTHISNEDPSAESTRKDSQCRP